VPEYLVETYEPRNAPSSGVARATDLSRVTEQLTTDGEPVQFVRSISLPEEETCFFLFVARSADAVREAATRAGLRFDRVVEVLPEGETRDATRTARTRDSDTSTHQSK